MGRGGARKPGVDPATGQPKKNGRPQKPKIVLHANKGVASEVLAMDGPPDHARRCRCEACKDHRERRCKCIKVHEQPLPDECKSFADHKVCRCEQCGWWALMVGNDRRLAFETRRYLTDRRDGKPAQGVFIGDTRESARELDFGDLPELIAPSEPGAAGKPN
jgi:hypothetical protein